MAAYKQDMPPPGGYAAINYQRVPPKLINVWWAFGAYVGVTAFGWYLWNRLKRVRCNDKIEIRCAELAVRPLLIAEKDRMMLKQLKKNRDDEEKLMADYPNWEVGKLYDLPVYTSFKPNEYVEPTFFEYFSHTDKKSRNKVATLHLNV